MADSTKVTDVSAVTVSAKVLANIIGVGDRQVRNLADEGILVRNSHGRYLLEKSVKNYIMNLKISKVGETVTSDFEDGELDLKQEQARHEHIKSMISEARFWLSRRRLLRQSRERVKVRLWRFCVMSLKMLLMSWQTIIHLIIIRMSI